MKKSLAVAAVAALLGLSIVAQAATIDWKGVTWDLQNANAVVNANGSLTLTSLVTGSVAGGLHANRLSSSFADVMNPYIKWSFSGHKGDILIDKEDTVKPGNPSIQAGSLWESYWAVTRYTAANGSRQELYMSGVTEASSISHVVTLAKRVDGTVDSQFDSDAAASSTFLKDNVGGDWGFQDVYLRMRAGTAGDTITFNDFEYGASPAPVPEPGSILAALSILGPAGILFRRRKLA